MQFDQRNNPFTQLIYAPTVHNDDSSRNEENLWIEQDSVYEQSMPDQHFVRRQCHRTLFIYKLRQTLKELDGLAVTENETKLSGKKMNKLKAIVKRKSLHASSVDKSFGTEDEMFSPFKNWKPLSKPMDGQVSSGGIRLRVDVL